MCLATVSSTLTPRGVPMSLSRRSFVRTVSAGGAGALVLPWVSARGMEAAGADAMSPAAPTAGGVIRLSSNENPHGPAPEAIDAIRQAFVDANRYPEAYTAQLVTAVAAAFEVAEANVVVGCGSGELLRVAVEAFTSPARALVSAAPTFELPEKAATTFGHLVRSVPVRPDLGLDLEAMAAAANGAGLVYLCNPNNPTASAHPARAIRETIAQIHRTTPDAAVLVDEAYFEFCDLPGYETMIPDALADPRLLVTRTFSKVHGLAGLRVGFAIGHPETISRITPYRLGSGVGVLSSAAARASLRQLDRVPEQVRLNDQARAFTRHALEQSGYTVAPTYANFMMFDARRDTVEFQRACASRGVQIGRAFPPLTTHARISVGTMDEMQRAMELLAPVFAGEV